jgi:hypothetical protein
MGGYMAKTKAKKEDHGLMVAAPHGIARSSKWPGVEKAHKAKFPTCAACGRGEPKVGIQVHHVYPFHYVVALGRPDLELDDRNLISLCETESGKPSDNHHLLVGHLDNFKSSNLGVIEDAKITFHGMKAAAIQKSAAYLKKIQVRLTPLDEMTDAEKKALRKEMDTRIPKK